MHLVVKENTVSSSFSGDLRWPIVNIALLMSLRSDCGLFLLPSDRKASCLLDSSLCAKLTGCCGINKQQPEDTEAAVPQMATWGLLLRISIPLLSHKQENVFGTAAKGQNITKKQ